uniref:Uncharacterized protein n=1 Tax=Arundo donax TaxID=35708 RepID=A0A0A9GM93_ARUDO
MSLILHPQQRQCK